MIFSSGLSAFGSDPGKSDSVRLQNLCTMLFSMFVSLPTGQVFRKRTVSSFFRIGPTLVIGTFARCEALFSFSSANFYIIASISISVNSFFQFFYFYYFESHFANTHEIIKYVTEDYSNRYTLCEQKILFQLSAFCFLCC